MTCDKPPILPAPAGTEAAWTKPPRDLVIWLDEDLDEVTRERYIAQAMAEHGLEYRRRHGLLPLPLAAGVDTARHAVRSHKAIATAATVSVLTAGGIALAVVHDDYHAPGHPPGAAPAPRQSAPPHSTRPSKPVPSPTSPSRTRPSQPPTEQPTPTASTSLEPAVTAITSHLQPQLPLPTSLPITLPPPIGGRPTGRPTAVPTTTRAPTRVCVLRIHVDGARTVAVRLRVCLRT